MWSYLLDKRSRSNRRSNIKFYHEFINLSLLTNVCLSCSSLSLV